MGSLRLLHTECLKGVNEAVEMLLPVLKHTREGKVSTKDDVMTELPKPMVLEETTSRVQILCEKELFTYKHDKYL